MIETGLRARLETADSSQGAYPVKLPQRVSYPCSLYRLVSDPMDHTHQGPSGNVIARYDVVSIAETYAEAKLLAEQTRELLDGFGGTLGDVEVANIRHDGDRDLHDMDAENSRGLYMIVGEYILEYCK